MADLKKVEEALEAIQGYNQAAIMGVLPLTSQCERRYSVDKTKEALRELRAYREWLDSEELLTPVDVAKELESSFAPDNAADIAQHVYQPLLQAIKTIKESE